MNFFNALPYEIEHDGKIYKLTPAYDNVLNMYEEIKDLSPIDRLDVMAYYLMEEPVLDVGLILAITELLLGKAPAEEHVQPYFSFTQDAPYIYAAFRQQYGIDLLAERGKLHWWAFNALLKGLTADTQFVRILQIRQKPIPRATKSNREGIAQLLRLKSEYRLEISEEDRQANLQRGFYKMYKAMMGMAKKGGADE